MRAPCEFEYPQVSPQPTNSYFQPFNPSSNKTQFAESNTFITNLMNSARQQPTLASAFNSLSYDASYGTAARPPQVPHAVPIDPRYALSSFAADSTRVHPSRVANGLLQVAAPLESKKRLSFAEPGGPVDELRRPASFIGDNGPFWPSQWSGSDGLDQSGRLDECVSRVVRHGLDESFNLAGGSLFGRSLRAPSDLEFACEARESDHEGSESSQVCGAGVGAGIGAFPMASTGPLHLNLEGLEEAAADQSPLSTPNELLRRESMSGRASFGSQDLGYRSLDELGSTPVNTAFYANAGLGAFDAGARNTRLGSFHNNNASRAPPPVPLPRDRSMLARDLSGETDPFDSYHYSSSLSSETTPTQAADPSASRLRSQQRPSERFELGAPAPRARTGVWNSRLLPTYLFDEANEEDGRHSSSLISDSCASDTASAANELLTPLADERTSASAARSQRHHADSWNGPIGGEQQQQQQQLAAAHKASPLVTAATMSPAGEYMDELTLTPTRSSLKPQNSDMDTVLSRQSSSTSTSTAASTFGRPRASAPEFVPSAATLAASLLKPAEQQSAAPASSGGYKARAPTAAAAAPVTPLASASSSAAGGNSKNNNKGSAVPALTTLKPLTCPLAVDRSGATTATTSTGSVQQPLPPMLPPAGMFVPVGLSPEQLAIYYTQLAALLNTSLPTPSGPFDLQQYLLGLNLLALTTGSFAAAPLQGVPMPVPIPMPVSGSVPPGVGPVLPPNIAGFNLNVMPTTAGSVPVASRAYPSAAQSQFQSQAGAAAGRNQQQQQAGRSSHAGSGGMKDASRHQSNKSRSEAANELHTRLEECCEQFKLLEKERKKAEAELARQNPGKQISTADPLEGRVGVGAGGPGAAGDATGLGAGSGSASAQLPRMPANPSRVDRHVHDSLKEYSMVTELLAKMERLRGAAGSDALPARIRSAMERWLEGIRKLQARRKEEIVNTANRQRSSQARERTLGSLGRLGGAGGHAGAGDDRDLHALTDAIVELCEHTRAARAALWTALQLTIAAPVRALLDAFDRSFGALPSANFAAAAYDNIFRSIATNN